MLKINIKQLRIPTFEKSLEPCNKRVFLTGNDLLCECGYVIHNLATTKQAKELLALVEEIDSNYENIATNSGPIDSLISSVTSKSFTRVIGYVFNPEINDYNWNVACLTCRAYSADISKDHSHAFLRFHEDKCGVINLQVNNVA
jgi:hypothetical protein